MDAKELGGESAYPLFRVNPWSQPTIVGGLTKREEFARSALQGVLSVTGHMVATRDIYKTVARAAVGYADALLAELAKDTP